MLDSQFNIKSEVPIDDDPQASPNENEPVSISWRGDGKVIYLIKRILHNLQYFSYI